MKNRTLRNLITLVIAFLISPYLLYRIFTGFTIPYAELVVTTKCSLNCEACANLMPCYDCAYDVDMEQLIKSTRHLLDGITKISLLGILGGEPFMRKDLNRLLDMLTENKKAKKVKVVTNGTIIPNEAILKALKNKKVYVSISEYPDVDYQKLADVLKKHEIKFIINHYDNWIDFGNLDKRNFDQKTLQSSYAACASAECKTILNGRLYTCPRSSHGDDLGLIKANENEYVEILSYPKKALQKKLRSFYNNTYVKACDHCNKPWERPVIPCALQAKRKSR